MAALPCSAPDCRYTTADTLDNDANMQDKISVLRIHADTVHGNANTPAQNTAGPSVKAKMDRTLLNSMQAQMCKPGTSSQQGGRSLSLR